MPESNTNKTRRKERVRNLIKYNEFGVSNAPGFLTKYQKYLLTQIKYVDSLLDEYKKKKGTNFRESANWMVTHANTARNTRKRVHNKLEKGAMNNTTRKNIARIAGVRAALEEALKNA